MRTALALQDQLLPAGNAPIPEIRPVFDFPQWCRAGKGQKRLTTSIGFVAKAYADAGLSGVLKLSFSREIGPPMGKVDFRATHTDKGAVVCKVGLESDTGKVSMIIYARLDGVADSAAFAALKDAEKRGGGNIVSMATALARVEKPALATLAPPPSHASANGDTAATSPEPRAVAGSTGSGAGDGGEAEGVPEETSPEGGTTTRVHGFTKDEVNLKLLILELINSVGTGRILNERNSEGVTTAVRAALAALGTQTNVKSASRISIYLVREGFVRKATHANLVEWRKRGRAYVLDGSCWEFVEQEVPAIRAPRLKKLAEGKPTPVGPPPLAAPLRPSAPAAPQPALPAKSFTAGDARAAMEKFSAKLTRLTEIDASIGANEAQVAALQSASAKLLEEKRLILADPAVASIVGAS